MRKIILFIATSLDGFISGQNDEIDWLFHDQDYGYKAFYNSIDTVIMGRKTYDISLKLEKEPFKENKIIVFSKKKNVEYIQTPIQFVKEIKKQKGKDIWLVGGSEIVSILLNNNLIDEMRIFIHPLILGKGKELFKDIKNKIKLELVQTKHYDSGLVEVSYIVKYQ